MQQEMRFMYKNCLKEDKIFYSACTDRYYSIRQHLDCKSKNVIYLATCKKCKVQYVGSTSNEFKVRFRNHKSAMLTNKTTCELAVHYNRIEHQMSDFKFIVIEKLLMKVTVKLINAYSQGKRSGAPNFALSNLRASIKDPNSIQKIELGLIDVFYALLAIFGL